MNSRPRPESTTMELSQTNCQTAEKITRQCGENKRKAFLMPDIALFRSKNALSLLLMFVKYLDSNSIHLSTSISLLFEH